MDNEEIITTKSELQKLFDDREQKVKSEMLELMKQETARNTVPDLHKQTKISNMKARAEKHALGIAVQAMGMYFKEGIPMEDTYKAYGVEMGTLLPDAMKEKMLRQKTMTVGVGETGGYLVQEVYSPIISDLLQDTAVFLKAGPRTESMATGTKIIARRTAGSTASWTGEIATKTVSSNTFDLLRLSAHKLNALVPISNDDLKFTSFNVASVIQKDIATQIALKLDKTCLVAGTDTTYMPKSLHSMCTTANSKAMTSYSAPTSINTDIYAAKGRLVKALIPMTKPVWFMTPEARLCIESQLNSNGFPMAWATELTQKGTLLTYPVQTSTYMRNGSTTTSIIELVNMDNVIFGDVQGIEIKFTLDGTWKDGDTVHVGLMEDVSVFTAQMQCDMTCDHAEAITEVTGVTWGV